MTSVLVVDDEPAVRDLMARWLAGVGLQPRTAANADEALASVRAQPYDLAVIDVMMPGRDGLWLASQLRRDHPHLAIVIATAYTELLGHDADVPAIADLLIKPFQRERFLLAVDRGQQWRKAVLEEVDWHARLSMEVADRCNEICRLLRQQAGAPSAADALTAIVSARIPDTVAHSERVARYARSVARQIGLRDGLDVLEAAARFHDVGKAAMPEALLTKPSPLTPGEIGVMRRHVEVGAEILESSAPLRPAAPIVRASHEWFGGDGYPSRLSGSTIPIHSRVIAVVDAYDAMTQDRSYRSRLDSSDAVAELSRCSPSQFDPDLVAAFLSVVGRH